MSHALDIPYISQIDGPGAGGFRNDCGPACVAMFAHGIGRSPTVAEVYNATGVTSDSYIDGGQLVMAGSKWGVSLTGAYWDFDKLRATLDNGNPVIALVHYGTFSKLGKTESSFKGPHFLNVVGAREGRIIVHDPLWAGRGGEYLTWSEHTFYQAWHDARLDGNSSFYGLRCNNRFSLLEDDAGAEPPVQPSKPGVWGSGIVIARALYLRHHPGGGIITALRQGTTVDVLEPKKNGWYHVEWDGIEGWCGGNERYITVIEAPPSDPPLPDPEPQTKKFMELPESERWAMVQRHLIHQGVLGKDGYVLEE